MSPTTIDASGKTIYAQYEIMNADIEFYANTFGPI
jgi:hypothetical protein